VNFWNFSAKSSGLFEIVDWSKLFKFARSIEAGAFKVEPPRVCLWRKSYTIAYFCLGFEFCINCLLDYGVICFTGGSSPLLVAYGDIFWFYF
jgi:hypothetical protein